MRTTRVAYIALTLGLILAISSVSGQQIGEIFDPNPEEEGYFVYTTDDWKFMGPIANERSHLLAAAYGDNVPESLSKLAELELGVNTESN